jgi:hypothetical protein
VTQVLPWFFWFHPKDRPIQSRGFGGSILTRIFAGGKIIKMDENPVVKMYKETYNRLENEILFEITCTYRYLGFEYTISE